MRHRCIPLAVLLASVLAGCGGARPAQEPPPEEPTPAEPPPAAPEPSPAEPEEASAGRCLPVVNGCGCAYVCGRALRDNGDGTFEVIHDLQDSAAATCTVERRCFDAAGHSSPAPGTATETNCIDVFYDRTPCGGECIPSAEHLTCHLEGDRCVP